MISTNLIQSIGWTLIHSLWQGLAIFVVLKIAVRLTDRSDLKYGMGVLSMVLIVICSVATFFVLNKTGASTVFEIVLNADDTSPAAQSSPGILDWVNSNIIWFIRFWLVGFVIGIIRIASGLWYINRLRRNAYPVQDEWMDIVKNLSASLSINRVVTMAEAAVSSPMVVGFVKPMVLFPVGLLAGLTVDQVETILVHELSHVRRQDYIINLVQSVIETIFFFNPFVLLTSSLIREERENCCDDMVIAKGISPMSYVKTLAQLEAARSSSSLALGIAGSQNQLLNRIKRIMENSAKNDWRKGRLVPVALLFLGLICASWLSIGSENTSKDVELVVADTLKPGASREDGLKVIKKRSHNSWDFEAPVPPVEAVPEIEFVPDEDFAFAFEMPGMDEIPMPPAMDFVMPEIPMEALDFAQFDSIPGIYFKYNEEEWKAFEEQFTKKFKTEFKDFYEKNQGKIDKMMNDVRKDEAKRREAAEVVDLDNLHSKIEQKFLFDKMASDLAPMKEMMDMDLARVQGQVELAGEQVRAVQAMKAEQMAKQMEMRGVDMAIMGEKIRQESMLMEDFARRAEDYKKELVEMLRQDGYITKDESEGTLSINDENGNLTINGHKIKEKDRVKYEALRDRYFERKRDRIGKSE
jgi:bla regulator protein BlaR1